MLVNIWEREHQEKPQAEPDDAEASVEDDEAKERGLAQAGPVVRRAVLAWLAKSPVFFTTFQVTHSISPARLGVEDPLERSAPTLTQSDPSVMVEAVEAIGWKLAHVDHVWIQSLTTKLINTNHSGVAQGQYLFRR